MKIVCIADTHGKHHRMAPLPDGDVLVVAGDITSGGHEYEAEQFNHWLEQQPHDHKIVIAGNHDWCFERNANTKALLTNAVYLEDSRLEIDGIKFWGSPWQPDFCRWAFNLPRGHRLAAKWGLIPDDTDVLITHGPPFGILNHNIYEEHVGCEDLLRRVLTLKPKAHIFGHIHEAHGVHTKNDTKFVNASICDMMYYPVNAPLVIEV